MVRSVKEDLVIVDLDRGEYFSLNETGRVVWEVLPESADMGELIDRLAMRFSGDRPEIEEDVSDLLDELLERRLLLRS